MTHHASNIKESIQTLYKSIETNFSPYYAVYIWSLPKQSTY